MNQKIDGSALASCFKVAASSGKEINALTDALNNLFTEYLSRDKEFSSDKPKGDDRFDDSVWVYTDVAYSFPLKLQKKSKNRGKGSNDIAGYLGYQISMIGDGIAIPKNNEPVIHIFFWEEKVDFDEDYYMGIPLEIDTIKQVHNNRLIEWNPEGAYKKTVFFWTFSLRLTSLSSSEDLKRCIVEPAFKLLQDKSQYKDVLTALPDSIEGIIFYPDDASLIYETENKE
ncbi:MAG: hypothetical protein JST10_15005 [Bacteroidetes bacterium]|nr:hypothetical protein [Bacteroidota bacterium]